LGAYYKLEAPDGIYYPDATTNNYTATAHNVTTATGAPVPGGSSYSARFQSGGSAEISTPYHTPSWDNRFGGYAVSVWARPIDVAEVLHGTPGPVINSATLDILFAWSSGETTIVCNNASATIAGDLNQYQSWYHVVCSWDGANWTLYVNGELRGTAGWWYGNAESSLYIGNAWFSADIDEVRAYNRGLSATEVQNLYDCNMTNCTGTFSTTATVTTTNTTNTTATNTQTVTGTVTVTNTNTGTTTVTVTATDTAS
jgi:hypothetical protein